MSRLYCYNIDAKTRFETTGRRIAYDPAVTQHEPRLQRFLVLENEQAATPCPRFGLGLRDVVTWKVYGLKDSWTGIRTLYKIGTSNIDSHIVAVSGRNAIEAVVR